MSQILSDEKPKHIVAVSFNIVTASIWAGLQAFSNLYLFYNISLYSKWGEYQDLITPTSCHKAAEYWPAQINKFSVRKAR